MFKQIETRSIIHDICCNFYTEIKDLDNSEESWVEIMSSASRHMEKHNGSQLAKDLILALENEFERQGEMIIKNGK